MLSPLLSISTVLLAFAFAAGANPRVETPYGSVEGFEYKEGNVFLGIRYGKAPIGERRFEKAEKVDKWEGTLDATSFGFACYQTTLPEPNYANLSFSEDCLMMNVMIPKTPPPIAAGFPVIFYIHGGGFEFRSATELGYKEIVDNFNSRGIIFVTFSYRLGPLGSLTTGDDFLPGNLGLWDQKLAMDFAHEILPSFGGNVNEITIAGVSAGSASVSAFTLSPHTNRKFQRAIQISGSMFASYSIDSSTDTSSQLFFDAIGCHGDSKHILKCLKSKNVEEFLDAAKVVGGDYQQAAGVRYHPRIDYDFFPSDLRTLIRKAPKIPSVIGLTDQEMGLLVFDKSNGSAFAAPNYDNYSMDDLHQGLRRMVRNQEEVYEHVKHFYANPSAEEAKDSLFPIRQHLKLASDVAFNIPGCQEAIEKLENDWPIFLYLEDYYSNLPQIQDLPIKGAYHANEMPFVFGLDQPLPIVGDENDQRFQEIYVGMMASFATSGVPRVEAEKWNPADRNSRRFMNLNLKSRMKESGFFEDSVKFWTEELVSKVDPELFNDILPVSKRSAHSAHDISEF